jgi:hypothetical protein
MKALLRLLLACFVSLALAAPSFAAPPKGADAGQKAKDAFNEGRYDDALRWLEAVYEQEPSPGVVYNMGRVREAAGRIRDAYETYLRVLALPGVDANMRRLAEAQAEQLKPLKDKAVLRLKGVPGGAVAQVDASAVAATSADLQLEPGEHQLCVTKADQSVVRCARRRLEAGLRTVWEWDEAAGPTGAVVWTPAERVTGLELAGHPLLVDLAKLKEVVVAVGQHQLRVLTEGGVEEHRLVVAPGARLPMPGPPPEVSPEVDAAVAVVAAGAGGEGPGLWPWVVSGSGAAVAAGGVVLLLSAASDKDRVDGAGANERGNVDELSQAEAADIWEDARSKEKLGLGLVGVGAAAAVGGLVWWALAPKGGEGASDGGSTTVVAGPSGLFVMGRF